MLWKGDGRRALPRAPPQAPPADRDAGDGDQTGRHQHRPSERTGRLRRHRRARGVGRRAPRHGERVVLLHDLAQLDRQVLDRLHPLVGALGEAAPDQAPQLGRDLVVDLLHRDRLLVEDLVHRLDAGLGREGLPPGGRLVEDAAEREDVGAVVDRSPRHLLGGHVTGRPHHAAQGAAVGGEGRRLGDVGRALALLGELGEAEVEDLGEAVGRDHDVPGLEVAVHDPRRVRLGEPLRGLREVAEQGAQVRLVLVDEARERLPAHELHRDVVHRGPSPAFPSSARRSRPIS